MRAVMTMWNGSEGWDVRGKMGRLGGERETVSPILTVGLGELGVVSGGMRVESKGGTYGWKILPLPRPVILG